MYVELKINRVGLNNVLLNDLSVMDALKEVLK